MENAIPYCGDLHIDAGTKKLILNLLRSIRSVVPVAWPPGPCSPDENHGVKNLDEIRHVLLHARHHRDELEGVFNPDELLRYTRYVADYQDIISQIERTVEELKNCRDSALKFAGGMADLLEGHLQMTSSPAENIPVNSDQIKLKVV